MYLQVKLHKKDAAIARTVKRFLAYLMETHYRKYPDESIVVVFDMAGAGLSNVVGPFYVYNFTSAVLKKSNDIFILSCRP